MSSLSNFPSKAVPIALKSLAAGSISGTYARVGTAFGRGVLFLWLRSTLNADVTISFDGVTDWGFFPASGDLVLDIRTNEAALSGALGIWVKGTVATGSFYVSAIGV